MDSEHAGTASGINNACSRIAGLLAIAVFGIVMVGAFGAELDRQVAPLDLPPAAQQQLAAERSRLAAADLPTGISEPTRAALQQAIDEAFVAGFRLVMLVAAGLALFSAVSAALLIEDTVAVQEPEQEPVGAL